MYDILQNVNFDKESQEDTLKSVYQILEDVKSRIDRIKRNKHNQDIKNHHLNIIQSTIKPIFNRMIFSISGWTSDIEVSELTNVFNKLQQEGKAVKITYNPYINNELNIKEYPEAYINRKKWLNTGQGIASYKVRPRLFNTPIGNILATVINAPKPSFGSYKVLVIINDWKRIENGLDYSLCNKLYKMGESDLLKLLDNNKLDDKVNSIISKVVKKGVQRC